MDQVAIPNTMRYFTFDQIKSTDFFLTNRIQRSILPPVSVAAVKINGKPGQYPVSSELGPREFTIDVTILTNTYSELRGVVREIANWLYKDEDKPLIFSDEPDKYYMVRLTGDTSLEEIAQYGEGSLTFIASDPFAYEMEERVQTYTDFTNGTIFTNDGQVETFPRLEVTPTAAITYFRIANGNEFIYVEGSFVPNETIVVDHNTNQVYKQATGERIMANVFIESDFWSLKPGNNLMVASPSTLSLQVFWRERYL